MNTSRGFSLLVLLVAMAVIAAVGYGYINFKDNGDKTAHEEVSSVPQLSYETTYAVVNGEVYVLLSTSLCAQTETRKVEGADPSSFERLGGNYAKDKNRVYYLGTGDACSPEGASIMVLEEADPKTFSYDAERNHVRLGIDVDSVFHREVLLKGIDPTSMIIETDGAIIKDEDSIWFASGGCHFITYEEGDFAGVGSYKPPC